MRGLTDMQGSHNTGDKTFTDPAKMIGIYFDADTIEFIPIDDKNGSDGWQIPR
jgi:hypothetical protein